MNILNRLKEGFETKYTCDYKGITDNHMVLLGHNYIQSYFNSETHLIRYKLEFEIELNDEEYDYCEQYLKKDSMELDMLRYKREQKLKRVIIT